MKKYLFIILSLLLLFNKANAQETPPTGLKQLTTTSFYNDPATGDLWQYKGALLGWARIARGRDLPAASNGLTKTGNEIKLGGLLTNFTDIDASNTRLSLVAYENYNDGAYDAQHFLTLDKYGISMQGYNGVTFDGAAVNVIKNSVVVKSQFGSDVSSFSIDNTGYLIEDGIAKRGLNASAYYGANYTANTYTQKRYVDSVLNAAGSSYIQNQYTAPQYAYSWTLGAKYGLEGGSYSTISPLAISFDNLYVTTNFGNNGYVVTENSTGDERFSIIPDYDTTRISGSKPIVFKNRVKSELTPIGLLDVTNKKYVDSLTTASSSFASTTYLPKSGGTMTGDLILPSAIPANALSAAPKAYIDNLITGITWKNAVRVKTTANITLSGLQTIDGVSLAAGNRVLVNNETDPTKNGIYVVASGAWTRAADVDESEEINTSTVAVTAGTVGKNTQWTYIGTFAPAVGTDNIVFGQISGAGTYTNGTYLTLSGNVFDANLTAFDARYMKLTGDNLNITGTQRFYGSVQAYGNLNQYNYDGGNSLNINGLNGTSQYSIINMDNGVGNGLGIFHGNYASNTGGIILRDSVLKTTSGSRFLTTQDFNYTPANPTNYYDKTTSDGRYAKILGDNTYTGTQMITGTGGFNVTNGSNYTQITSNRFQVTSTQGQSAYKTEGFEFNDIVTGKGLYVYYPSIVGTNKAIYFPDENGTLLTRERADGRYLQLTGGTLTGTLNGAAAYFSGQVGAQTIALSSYTDALIPGQIAAGTEIKMGTINNSPFAGLSTYVNGVAEYRAGRAPGGTSYSIDYYNAGTWVSMFNLNKTSGAANFKSVPTVAGVPLSRVYQVATYAALLSIGTPSQPIFIRVATDENKSMNNANYIWYPDGKRVWIASTEDN